MPGVRPACVRDTLISPEFLDATRGFLLIVPDLTIHLPQLHAGQAAAYADDARYRVLSCGRRWGKTTLGRYEACMTLLGEGRNWEGKPYRKPMPVGWFAPTYKILDDAWREVVRTLGPVIRHKDGTKYRIELINGADIEFWSMDTDDPARSRKYAFAYIDEGGMVPKLVEIWQAAIRPTLTDWRGRALFGSTPKGMGSITLLYQRGEQGQRGWSSRRCPSTDNTTIDGIADEVEQARQDMPEDLWRQEYLGEPMGDAGNPFGVSQINGCIAPMSVGAPVVFGVDVALEADYTVVVGLDKDGAVCRFDRFNGGTWADVEARIVASIGKVPTIIDATGVGAPIAERIAKVNRQLTPFKFTAASKQQLMERLAVAIQNGKVQFPDGPIANELRTFQYQYSRSGTMVHVKYAAPHGLYDDCVCALALAVQGFESRPEGSIWVNGVKYAAA